MLLKNEARLALNDSILQGLSYIAGTGTLSTCYRIRALYVRTVRSIPVLCERDCSNVRSVRSPRQWTSGTSTAMDLAVNATFCRLHADAFEDSARRAETMMFTRVASRFASATRSRFALSANRTIFVSKTLGTCRVQSRASCDGSFSCAAFGLERNDLPPFYRALYLTISCAFYCRSRLGLPRLELSVSVLLSLE